MMIPPNDDPPPADTITPIPAMMSKEERMEPLDPEVSAIVDGFVANRLDRYIALAEKAEANGDTELLERMRQAVVEAFEKTIGKDLK